MITEFGKSNGEGDGGGEEKREEGNRRSLIPENEDPTHQNISNIPSYNIIQSGSRHQIISYHIGLIRWLATGSC